MPTIELDRTTLIRLPQLADDDGGVVPEPLANAHAVLAKTANEAASKAVALANDPRWSEAERQRQLSELCEVSELPAVTNLSLRYLHGERPGRIYRGPMPLDFGLFIQHGRYLVVSTYADSSAETDPSYRRVPILLCRRNPSWSSGEQRSPNRMYIRGLILVRWMP